MAEDGFCYTLVLVLAAALVLFGFFKLLQMQKPEENDTQVLQRQLRGFAFMILAQLVMTVGLSLCGGGDLNLRRAIRSVAM